MNIIFVNINGNLFQKLADPNFVQILRKYHIVIILESKLRSTDFVDLSTFGLTKVFRTERPSASGGVLVAVRAFLAPSVDILFVKPGSDMIFLKVDNKFCLGAVYIPPRGSKYFNSFDRFELLEECVENSIATNLPFIVVGDFNSRPGNTPQSIYDIQTKCFVDIPIDSYDTTVTVSGRTLLDICNRTNSIILTGKVWGPNFTCFQPKGASVVDTGFASPSILSSIRNGTIHANDFSDHTPISFLVDLKNPLSYSSIKRRPEVVPRRRILRTMNDTVLYNGFIQKLMKDPNLKVLIDRIRSLFMSPTTPLKADISSFVNDMYDQLNEFLTRTFNTNPTRLKNTRKRHNVTGPFVVEYDKKCLDARRAFRRVYRVFQRNRSDLNYAQLVFCRKLKVSNERRCRRFSESNYLRSILRCTNTNRLWKEMRLSTNTSYNGPISVDQYTSFLSNIASGNLHFDSKLSDLAHRRLNVLCLMSGDLTPDHMCELLESFPTKDVLSPKLNKATGVDGWSGELIRLLYPILYHILPYLFIICLKSGVTPDRWDEDVKVPVPKPGKPANLPNSLRPITLVNVMMKQYEHWIISLLDNFCTPSEFQAGFKKGYSCTGRLFVLRSILDLEVYDKKKNGVFAVFIDFSSFFDTIREEVLCNYLIDRKVPEYMVRAIHGMLSNVSASVFMKGKLGSSFRCSVGLRQGSKSSPRLATLFLDQLTDSLVQCRGGIDTGGKRINHIFYADDLVLVFDDWNDTQFAIDVLDALCKKVGLSVSIEKSFSVHFCKSKKKGIKDFCWGSSTLRSLNSAKYLGCTLSNRVKFSEHLQSSHKKANRAFSILMNFQKRFPSLPFSDFLNMYYTLVYPSYAYSCEVFAWADADKLDDIFTDHLRRYLGLSKTTSKMAIHYITGTLPIQVKMYSSGYKFWSKVSKLGEDRLEKIAYRVSKNYTSTSWFKDMLEFFSKIGFDGDHIYWGPNLIKAEFPRFEETTTDFYRKKYLNWAKESSYRFLTTHFEFGQTTQLLDGTPFWNRRILSRFLLRGFNFESSLGGRHKRHPHDRYCRFCFNTRRLVIPGDDSHYLSGCPRFDENRQTLCTYLNISPENIELNLVQSVNSTSASTVFLNALAKFIRKSFCQLPDPYDST